MQISTTSNRRESLIITLIALGLRNRFVDEFSQQLKIGNWIRSASMFDHCVHSAYLPPFWSVRVILGLRLVRFTRIWSSTFLRSFIDSQTFKIGNLAKKINKTSWKFSNHENPLQILRNLSANLDDSLWNSTKPFAHFGFFLSIPNCRLEHPAKRSSSRSSLISNRFEWFKCNLEVTNHLACNHFSNHLGSKQFRIIPQFARLKPLGLATIRIQGN